MRIEQRIGRLHRIGQTRDVLIINFSTLGTVEEHVLELDDRAKTFALRDVSAPRRVAIDPQGAQLARITLKLPAPMLRELLASDPSAPVRWRAAQALVRHGEDVTVAALRKAVGDDAFWGVSAEAARALGELRGAGAFEALAANVAHPHPKVRRAVVKALGEFRSDAAAALLLGRIAAGDASWLVEGELLRSAGRTRRAAVYDALVAALGRESWREVLRAGAVDGLAALRDPRAGEVLLKLLVPGASPVVRRAVVDALAELGDARREVREAIEGLLDEDDPYVVPDALRALAKLKDAGSVDAVSRLLRRTDDGRVRRAAREALRALQAKDGDAELRRMRDELEALRDELRTLRDRVAAVEPKPRAKPRRSRKA